MPGWLSSLRDLIAEASPLRRLMLALLGILPLAALAAAYFWLNPPSYRVLYAQLSDRAGGEVIVALEQLDIPYRLSAADGSIEVPADQLHVARYRLAARGLPRSDEEAEKDETREPLFGASSLQAQQRYQHALEMDLARSIQTLEAVELARVHLALPKVSPFLRDAPPATAAVLVRLRAGRTLDDEQVATIQTLVAASVPRLRRDEVQVLDPRGVLLGGAVPEAVHTQRLAIEQDLVRRGMAVLQPWLGTERVSLQVTATLEDSETRQTTERVRNVIVGGQPRPLEKTVRTTRTPEGRVQRVSAIVILGFEASAAEQRRARQLVWQALGMQRARGDSLEVFVLPATAPRAAAPAETPASPPQPAASIPQVRPQVTPTPAHVEPVVETPWMLAMAALLGLLGAVLWRRRRGRRHEDAGAAPEDDFDVVLTSARSQTLANPRVTADVVRLWMRA